MELLAGSRIFGNSRHSLRNLLSAAQVALSLVLLSSAGLLLRSLWNLQNVATGLNSQQVVAADITVGPASYPNSQSRQQFFDDLASRLRTLQGISSVAVSDSLPPSGFVHSRPLGSLMAAGAAAAGAGLRTNRGVAQRKSGVFQNTGNRDASRKGISRQRHNRG